MGAAPNESYIASSAIRFGLTLNSASKDLAPLGKKQSFSIFLRITFHDLKCHDKGDK